MEEACCHDFIMRLEDGYDTVILDEGKITQRRTHDELIEKDGVFENIHIVSL